MGNVKVHWHVVPVRSCWTPSTLSTSCCCLHGGHRLELEIIPMPDSCPTLLLAPTSRPVLTEQPSCSLPSAAAGHPPISRAAIVAWRTEGWPAEEAAAAGLPTTGDGFRPLWQLAGGACGASCADPAGAEEMESGLRTCFPTHPRLLLSALRPWLGHSPKP